ncbi:MAG: hypothetical protein U1F43_28995 [Myxococcota bacterium]
MRRLSVLGLGVMTCMLGGTATAETPSSWDTWIDCGAGWWVPRNDVPLTVSRAPAEPTILLPVTWSSIDPDLDALAVTVLDADGATIAGTVSYPGPSAPPLGLPRWRPLSPLALDASYTLTVRVADPPGSLPEACGLTAFERSLAFDTSTAPTEPASLAIVSLEARDRWSWNIGVGADMCAHPIHSTCPSDPSVCCDIVRTGREREVVGDILIERSGGIGAPYLVLRTELRAGPGGAHEAVVEHVAASETWYASTSWWVPGEEPPGDDACLVARLENVLLGRVVAEDERCGLTDSYADRAPPVTLRGCPLEQCPGGQAPDASDATDVAVASEVSAEAMGVARTPASGGCASTGSGAGWLAAIAAGS